MSEIKQNKKEPKSAGKFPVNKHELDILCCRAVKVGVTANNVEYKIKKSISTYGYDSICDKITALEAGVEDGTITNPDGWITKCLIGDWQFEKEIRLPIFDDGRARALANIEATRKYLDSL